MNMFPRTSAEPLQSLPEVQHHCYCLYPGHILRCKCTKVSHPGLPMMELIQLRHYSLQSHSSARERVILFAQYHYLSLAGNIAFHQALLPQSEVSKRGSYEHPLLSRPRS